MLLIDNYFEKWPILAERDIEDTEPAQEAETGKGRGKKKANTRRPGKYTKKVLGHCKYGGWNSAGIQQFNALCKLVEQDRVYPGTNGKGVDDFLQDKHGGKDECG